MPRAVLDTNVLVSSVISARGAPREVLNAWRDIRFDLVTSPLLIAEVGRALRYPRIMQRYGLTDADVRLVLVLLWTEGLVNPDPVKVEPLTGDPADDLVVAVCREGECEYLVTGDRGLLSHDGYGGIRILTPREFLQALRLEAE